MSGLEGLRDTARQPFPFGLSFIPEDLAGACGDTGDSDPVAGLVRLCEDLDAAFAFVPEDSSHATALVDALIEAGVAPMWVLSGPLWPLIEERGVLEGLRQTLTDPEGFCSVLDHGIAGLSGSMRVGHDLGSRVLVLAEDLAGSEGPLVAPDFVIGELMPRYGRLTDEARELGVPVVLHSDGDIRVLLPSIARAGFAGVHVGGGLTVDGYLRIVHAAQMLGLAVFGGLMTGELVSATRAEALGGLLGRLARSEGIFLADDGGITTGEELERLTIALGIARGV